MFCFQCQQTAGNQGCIKTGVCGKQPSTANLQDELVAELIRLAQTALDNGKMSHETDDLLMDGLFTTLTNVNFSDSAIKAFTERVVKMREALGGGNIIVGGGYGHCIASFHSAVRIEGDGCIRTSQQESWVPR